MHQNSMQCNSMKKVSLDREHQKSIILSSIVCYRIAVTALLPLLFFFLVEDLPIRLLHPAQLDVCTQAVILQYLVKLRNTNTLFFILSLMEMCFFKQPAHAKDGVSQMLIRFKSSLPFCASVHFLTNKQCLRKLLIRCSVYLICLW